MPRLAAALTLTADRPLRLTGALGREVVALDGIVWITARGHAEDIFIAAGERYRIATSRLVLVEAIGSARVRIEARSRSAALPAVPRALLRRTARAAAGLWRKMRSALPPPQTDPA